MGHFSELDMYLFGQATHYDIYNKLGAHPLKNGNKEGVCFDVWAPHAKRVWVIGDFNGWDENIHEMERLEPKEAGIYELFVEAAKPGQLYKYLIETANGEKLYKADPFASCAELRPGTASRIADLSKIKWSDKKWMDKRAETSQYEIPISIYEVHPGSWMRHPGRNDDGFYTYRELAKALTDYVKDMGYTHVELIGISEYPYDGSWGYQVTGYYAPTSRYGSPEDFAYFVNYLHRNNIGIILDWVPAHFPKDEYGLATFDGEALYEYPDLRMGEHPEWGTKIFNYGLNQVKNFLLGSALMWAEFYHIDGLRVDAVASMLYLDYGKKAGEWVANKYGENKNLEAVEFFRHLNTLLQGRNKGLMMIAEESTAWPQVTGGVEDSAYSLAFSYKWNMGWMHDFLDYMKLDPLYRKGSHNKMTFAMSYNSSENYILVLSHDEVVHLKCSMINKMPGLGHDKFANLMVGYAFMFGHPGKKLLFMGQDFGQLHEWDEKKELDWYLIDANPEHKNLQNYVRKLLHIYKANRSLFEWDRSWESFEWINADDAYRSIFSFVRKSRDGKNNLLFVCNFTPVKYDDYRVGVPEKKTYKLILNSEDEEFGGSGEERPVNYKAEESPCDNREYSIGYPLPAYGVAIFKY
ncbi:MAG: 1,4-alpha-glucan branching protein GlgB [Lachnospiraceae bacterium]|nr:1,4-alpha-glucan branching protein GlgB [Lachnospiraceae bacterium]